MQLRATKTKSTLHRSDGVIEESVSPSVTFELAPGKLDAMVAWSRQLELRDDDGYALLLDGKLLFIERRALWEDSNPGISNIELEELCAKTKKRTLPSPE